MQPRTIMNNCQRSQESRPWLWLSVACLVVLAAAVMLSRTVRSPRRATVTIDTKGTSCLGGVLPLQNKTVRDVGLTAAGYFERRHVHSCCRVNESQQVGLRMSRWLDG